MKLSVLAWRNKLSAFLRGPIPLLLLSVAVNISLAARVTALNGVVRSLKTEGQLQVGARLDSVEATLADGTPVTVRFADSQLPTFLYVMRPACVWCERNKANLRAILSEGRNTVRVVLISMTADGLDDWIKTNKFDALLVTNPSEQAIRQLKLGGTPCSIVVSPDGIVLHSWPGAFMNASLTDAEATLGIQMPGLTQ